MPDFTSEMNAQILKLFRRLTVGREQAFLDLARLLSEGVEEKKLSALESSD